MQKIRRAGYLLVLIMGVALTTAFVWHPKPPERFTGLGAVAIPTTVEGYHGSVVQVDSVTKAALNSADIAERHYEDNNGQDVDLILIGGTDRDALHDPRSCLVGSGWQINNDHVENLIVDGKPVPARTCTITQSEAPQAAGFDVLYIYVTHKRIIASATQIRLALLESALLEQNDAPVYFVRLITPFSAGANAVVTHQRLIDFSTNFWRQLSPTILKQEHA